MTPNIALGVTPRAGGVEIGVYSNAAEAIEFCTFDEHDAETGRTALPGRTGNIFHGFIPDIAQGTRYGLRARGQFAPGEGNRFNPNMLLLDPYATRIDRPFALHPALFDTGEAPSSTDSAPFMPKALVTALPGNAPAPPPVPWDDLVIYELHVKGFTVLNEAIPQAQRGTFAGLAHPASIDYLRRLGVSAVEVLPSAAWIDERHLGPLGLGNYWGYNPAGFCAPDPRLAPGGFAEIRAAVSALRQAGIATIFDVVFNHTGEGDELGPTVSLRGLDNAYYYRLDANNRRLYANDTACGNVVAADRPGVVRLIMDALRLWASATGADGFRFDLATTLGRAASGFDAAVPLLSAMAQDPVLRDRILVAEPWDVGPGGYRLGEFGAPWAEWNDHFRDTARRFWRGDGGMLGDLATRLAGSADIFGRTHRPPSRSINFLTAHDGFTLRDLVSYTQKRNDANGEHNRDGTDSNYSWNDGVEGPIGDAAVNADRARDTRALLATLLFARGTPMMTMGDESGRTQQGNNNAYAQDNPLSWFDWKQIDTDLLAFTQRAIALRRSTAALHEDRMLTGSGRDDTSLPDVAWLRADGAPMTPADWQDGGAHTLIAVFYTPPARAMLVLHSGPDARAVTVPVPLAGHGWVLALDSFETERSGDVGPTLPVSPRSVVVLVEQPRADTTGVASAGAGAGVDLPALRRVAVAAGVALDWWDVEGTRHPAPAETLQAVLAAQDLPAGKLAQARDSLSRLAERRDLRALPAALVVQDGAPATLALGPGTGGRDRWLLIEPEGTGTTTTRLKIAAGDGVSTAVDAADGRRFTGRRIDLPPLPAGRYRMTLDGVVAATHLTAAPASCHLPASLSNGGRRFGVAAHLYTLRRDADQGVGDFTALGELARVAGAQAASVIGLNPLHALFRSQPDRASPYHPADRRFLNPIYVDVTRLGALDDAPAVRAALAAEAALLTNLRPRSAVDYPEVWQAKTRVLRAAFDSLPADQATGAALGAFIAHGGTALRDFTVWEALAEIYGPDWHVWPEALRGPFAAEVTEFAAAHESAVRFSAFLQFLAERGLAEAAGVARDSGLDIGLYRDLAVGCAPDGAEAWSEHALLLRGVSVGAPPDSLGPLGQVWHVPPPDPIAMEEDGYCAFGRLLATNMRHAGALRIDHVMGLMRLFVIPAGAQARDGTYLSYKLNDLMGQVALESTQAGCLVVGEDLGTVPPEIGVALAARSVLSYRVLWFERTAVGVTPPAAWPRLAAACVSTHDLPTLAGWWSGGDIAELVALGLMARDAATAALAARQDAKAALLRLLRNEGLIGEQVPDTAPVAAVHALIARTPSLLALVQADDLSGELVGVNLPGTDRERPNWQRRLASTAEALRGSGVLAAMYSERPR
jgi:glycogen debranching enzyme GlgX/4-alpha-glucanotransferase